MWFGWLGFNGGSTFGVTPATPAIVAKTILAGSSGLITALALGWLMNRAGDVGLMINGSLAGLVSITAGCHAVSAPSAVLIGAIAAVVMMGVDSWIQRAKIDDVVEGETS